MDAVIGNPPFVRYQEQAGDARKRSARAALAQGVRLSGLASSWVVLLVHACGFLKPDGRLTMVLPAELLTVHYAEPAARGGLADPDRAGGGRSQTTEQPGAPARPDYRPDQWAAASGAE